MDNNYCADLIYSLFKRNSKIRELYKDYLIATTKNYSQAKTFNFVEIALNVSENLPEESTLEEALTSVLEAMVYTSENSVDDMIARAEADFPRRWENMTPEQQEVCEKYRIGE